MCVRPQTFFFCSNWVFDNNFTKFYTAPIEITNARPLYASATSLILSSYFASEILRSH